MIKFRNDSVLPQLEQFRQMKTIGKSLEASINVKAAGDYLEYIKNRTEELRELVNVSQIKIEVLEEKLAWNEMGKAVTIITKADGKKCERCWHWETDVGSHPEHPTICGRCFEAAKQINA